MMPMGDLTFRARLKRPSRIIELAKVLHDAAQRSVIYRVGYGQYVTWDALPQIAGGQQEIWIAAAEAALAHFASDPAFPIASYMPGGLCG
jgi:hypothetical protein